MHSKFVKTSVTCVKFLREIILAGVGGEIHVHCPIPQKEATWELVHCLEIFPPQNIYGIIPREHSILIYGGRNLAIIEFNDDSTVFRLSKKYFFEDWILDTVWLSGNDEIAILTANNFLHKYDLNSGKTKSKLKSEELCILYSGKILNTVWEEIVILAGTVFQEIIVWDHCFDMEISQTLHRLKGHKGVIFSITFDTQSNMICSTSDDRTVRIWEVHFPSTEKKRKWKESKISLKISIFSHVARVWKSHIISMNRIISIGEDSLISIWNEKGDCINNWNGHQGGAVWSTDCSEEHSLIATGGSDGGINIWPLCDNVLPSVIYSASSCEKDNIPRSVAVTHNGIVVIMTNKGKLLHSYGEKWIENFENEKYASYCVLQMSPSRKLIGLGSINGHLTVLRVGKDELVEIWSGDVFEGRIFSLLWLTESLLMLCAFDGVLTTWQLSEIPEFSLKQLKEYCLPKSKERWITSSLLFEEYIICGDRYGSLHLYQFNASQKDPLHTLNKVHGFKGVTAIKFIGDTIISTGRDGTYRRLIIQNNSMKILDSNKLQMEWIATIEETLEFGEVIIGFYDIYLVIWSYKENRPILKLDCGGGHRSWDCRIDEHSHSLIITFIKNKTVFSYHRPTKLVYNRTAEVGYHSKSINAATLLDIIEDKNFILTGGEDNTLRLFSWDRNKFNPETTLHRHISSIRAISCIKNKRENSFFVASCGGRGQLIMWQLLKIKDKIKIEEITSHMVREGRSKQINTLPLPDPETRYMDISIHSLSESMFLILAGCSDGFFRLLNFNSNERKITLIKACCFHDHCILKVAHFKWKGNFNAITMSTAGTVSFWDINALLSEEIEEVDPVSYSVHSLGINSYSLLIEKDNLILATGSDDSTLAITAFKLNKNNKHSLITSWMEKTLHSCQITGVQILENIIISVALDQKISMLKWTFHDDYFSVALVFQIATSIPDIHGLLAWVKPRETINVCVYGLGIQLFEHKLDNGAS